MQIILELAPTHLEGRRLSLFERSVLAALHHMGDNILKIQDALGHAAQTEAAIEEEVTTLLAEVADEKTAISTAVADAVTKALADAGATQEQTDAANEAAAAALDDKLGALQAKLTTALTPTPVADLPPAPTPEPAPAPEPVSLSVSPTSVTGVSGTPVSGQFQVAGNGTAPFTFKQDGAVGDFTTTPDGFFAMNPTSPMTSSVNITATDANGVESSPTSVSISIS